MSSSDFDWQHAYVLHARPYRETSLLLELFSKEVGRVAAIAKGARAKRSPLKGLLQPFTPIVISLIGKHALQIVRAAEIDGAPNYLTGQSLLSAFYLNELLLKLLQHGDAHSDLFLNYQKTILALTTAPNIEIILRLFEKNLLSELGYGLQLQQEAITGNDITENSFYQYQHQLGFIETKNNQNAHELIFSGKNLLAIALNQFHDDGVLRDAKKLFRYVLAILLGHRPLKTRELFMSSQQMEKQP